LGRLLWIAAVGGERGKKGAPLGRAGGWWGGRGHLDWLEGSRAMGYHTDTNDTPTRTPHSHRNAPPTTHPHTGAQTQAPAHRGTKRTQQAATASTSEWSDGRSRGRGGRVDRGTPAALWCVRYRDRSGRSLRRRRGISAGGRGRETVAGGIVVLGGKGRVSERGSPLGNGIRPGAQWPG